MSDANPKRGWGNPLVRRLLAVAASLALVLSLGACVGRNGVKPFPITPEIASAMPCEPTVGPSPLQVSNTIAALAEAKAPGRRAGLEDWGLNPDLKDPAAVKAIDEVRSALRKRVDECQKAKPSPSATPTSSTSPSATPSSTPTASASPSATPSATETSCPAEFVQKLDPNRKYRFVSSGLKGSATKKRKQLLAALGHDHRYLAFVGEQLFHTSIEESKLVKDDCLSVEGQTLYAKVSGALLAAGVKNGKAPADSYNTGMEKGKAVVAKKRGVYGDRKATIYTLADGSKVVILDRCGNLVFPSRPKGLPVGKTDNPPPPKRPPHSNPPPPVAGKKVWQDPAQRGNVPRQVKGKAPKARKSHRQPSRPADPPATYKPPAPPKSSSPKNSTPTKQPSESPAKNANDADNDERIDEPDD